MSQIGGPKFAPLSWCVPFHTAHGALEEADFDYHHISHRYIYMCTVNICMYYTYELIDRYSAPGDLTSNL